MNHKKITSVFFVLLLGTLLSVRTEATQPPQNFPGMGGQALTVEDLQAMEQAVEMERAKMTPAERAQFDNDVAQLTKELEQMKPEDLEMFIDQVLFGQPAPEQPMPEVTPVAQPVTATEAPKAAPRVEVSQKMLSKQEEALQKIDGIIKNTESFLNKVAIMVEFPGKIKKWAEQGTITGWRPNYMWDTDETNAKKAKENISIKKQLEELVQKLSTLKEKDPKTKNYKHLSALIDDESLYNNLGKLYSSLVKLEPQVEVYEFGLEQVSKEVRKIMRKILSEYIEALFSLDIPADIDKVIARYTPTAKQLTEEEEKATKKAFEESKKKQKTERTVVAGKAESADDYSGGSRGGSDYYNPYSSPYYSPDYSSGGRDDSSHDATDKQGGDKQGGAGKSGSSGSDTKKDDKEKDEKGDGKSKGSGSKDEKKEEPTSTAKLIQRLNDALFDARWADDYNTILIKLKQATGIMKGLKKALDSDLSKANKIDKVKKDTTEIKKTCDGYFKDIEENLKPHQEELTKKIIEEKKATKIKTAKETEEKQAREKKSEDENKKAIAEEVAKATPLASPAIGDLIADYSAVKDEKKSEEETVEELLPSEKALNDLQKTIDEFKKARADF
ncbi:MAG: hypothetical protein NTX86_01710 [Candidatus Dependentiae bacterium]|nr:hypothetical protein [Candidatus Dependentiae bacterium]